MSFLRLQPTDLLYQQIFGRTDIRGFEVYTNHNEAIGRVIEVLVDSIKQSYFLVLEMGSWLSRKRVVMLLPQFQLIESQRRLDVTGLTMEQVRNLPAYNPATVVDQDAIPSNQVPGSRTMQSTGFETSVPLEASLPLEAPPAGVPVKKTITTADREVLPTPVAPPHTAVHPPALQPPASQHREIQPTSPDPFAEIFPLEAETIQLLEERLVVDRHRRKVGDVIVRKVIETKMVEVPVRRETLVVEQISPERKQLATINLNQGAIEGLELREPMSTTSDPQSLHYTEQIRALPIASASQILSRLMQMPQFNHAQVKMIFSDQELQTHYERWLSKLKG